MSLNFMVDIINFSKITTAAFTITLRFHHEKMSGVKRRHQLRTKSVDEIRTKSNSLTWGNAARDNINGIEECIVMFANQ